MIYSARRLLWQRLLTFFVVICSALLLAAPTALAGLNDDNFDGNIFALYGGNGSLIPAKVKLADSLKGSKPALLIFFVDDSKDCKKFSTVVSQLQSFYGRAANFIPVNVDSIFTPNTDDPTKVGYYYEGFIPQTVLIDQEGKVVLNVKGQTPFAEIDDAFREVFDLLPRSESVELKRKVVNEVNTELSN